MKKLNKEEKIYFNKKLKSIEKSFNTSKTNDKLNTSYPIKKEDWQKFLQNEKISFNDNKICLYFHIPFCKKLCKFCEYIKFAKKDFEEEKLYIQCLLDELKEFLQEHKNKTICGLDIGGGTPIVLDDENFDMLLYGIKDIIKNENFSEDFLPSIEGTFDTINSHKINTMVNCGFKRISFGIQTFNKKILKQNNRENGSISKMLEVFAMCKTAGIEIINIDLMYGLKNQTISDLKSTMKVINILKPEHLTFYEFRTNILMIKENFNKNDLFQQYKCLYKLAKKYGYKGRFAQNTFSKINDEGLSSYLKYRMLYFVNYKGFGIASQSKGDNGLSYNYGKNHEEYTECFAENKIKLGDSYILPNEELLNKFIAVSGYYGLFEISCANKILQSSFENKFKFQLEFLLRKKYIEIKDDKLIITQKGFKYYGAILNMFYQKTIEC